MIIVDTLLKQRAEEGRPIRVGLWGAGEMAKGMVNQVMRYTPGMEVAVIANRTIGKALEAYEYTGTEAVLCNDLDSLQQTISSGGFAVTGGQMWSLVTENGRSTDNRTEKLPNTVDPQYMVGFNWARQPAIRFQQRFGELRTGQLTAAVALENAQITNFTATSATAGAVPANFYFAGTGANGGLFNAFNGTYANNVAPDVIVKVALDYPKSHWELGGLARFMREQAIRLRHPHVVAPIGWAAEDDVVLLVMELVTGGSVQTLLDRRSQPRNSWLLGIYC